MKQFFKFMFASMLGVLLAFLVFGLLFAGFVTALVSSFDSGKQVAVQKGSVLHIRLDQPVAERTSKNPFDQIDFSTFKSIRQPGLYDIVKSIGQAADDSRIEGIFLNVSNIQAGLAGVEEIRNALLRFKESEKFVVSYADFYSQSSYYLATAADEIWLQPEGLVEFRGYLTELLFFKGTFDKLDIEPQVIRHGKYKSAVEPLVNEKMSEENRIQIGELVTDFWNHTLAGIAHERHIEQPRLKVLADSLAIPLAEDALAAGLVDKLRYEDEAMHALAGKTGQDSTDKPTLISLDDYSRVPPQADRYVRERIAVVFGTGVISGGEGDNESIGSRTLVKALRSARQDDHVKAIVLRVNSPGGQALASDEIWREVSLAVKEKPVVVSMGDLAASGGYYISCAATRIIAQPNTVTGSIGVLGVVFNVKDFLKNKLGMTTDQFKTNRFADLGLPTHALSEGEKRIIQHVVEDVYGDFAGKVAEGRHLPVEYVDSIGQGRIWSGQDARRLGLVDTLGNFSDAIAMAAGLAGIEHYRIRELPEQKEPLQQIMEDFGTHVRDRIVRSELGEAADYYFQLKNLAGWRHVQARLPFQLTIR